MTNEDACPCCLPERASVDVSPQSAGRAIDLGPPRSTRPANGSLRQELARDLVDVSGGSFLMGSTNRRFPADGEGPVREVTLDPFSISSHEVTNRQFADFVADTGYVTEAEKFGWSFVFHHFVSPQTSKSVTSTVQSAPWWWRVDRSSWKHPEGPDSTWEDRPENPVVHMSWNDAEAFAGWAEMRLPTEAEWECAARGGLEQAAYAWGEELTPNGRHMCNIWQGEFPRENSLEDGFHGAAPVGSFPPNSFGLYDLAGNVWEWCLDWWSATFHQNDRRATRVNPKGPRQGQARVIKGGSYLCHDSYCNRYRVGARTSSTPDSSTGNMGFRLARSV
jgi:formylglycine-generating enzyme required for sulfatase activity